MSTIEPCVENVSKAIQLPPDPKSVRVLMAQTRQPLADKNGQDRQPQGGRKGPTKDKGVAEMRQELAEASNTIAQLHKNQEQSKRQRRDNLEGQRNKQWHDQKSAQIDSNFLERLLKLSKRLSGKA